MDKNQLKRLAGLPVVTEKQTFAKVEVKTPPKGLFMEATKAEVCVWLKENHADYASAVATLNKQITAAGRTLDVARRATLEACKDELRKAYGVKEALEPFDMQLLRKMAGLAPVAEPVVEKEEEDDPAASASAEGDVPAEEAEDEMPAIIAKIAAKVEGKTGDELIALIQKVYDAGFKDGEEAHEEEAPEGEEEVKEAAGEFVVYHDDGKNYPIKKRVSTLATAQKHAEAMGKEYKTASFEYWSDKLNPSKQVKEAADSKGKEIKAGCKLIWKDANGEHTGTVEADPKYNGGLRVGGRSVKNIIDDSDSVMVVESMTTITNFDGFKSDLMKKLQGGSHVTVTVKMVKPNVLSYSFQTNEDAVTEAARKPKATEPAPTGNITASVGVDKEDDAGWMAVELAKAGLTVDMEEAMGVFYFNFKNKADEAKAAKIAAKLQIALV